MDAVVAPVLQRNEVPPDAVSVTGAPAQMVGLAGTILQITVLVTVTVTEHELVQPFASVTVTVYVVVTFGLTVIAAVVALVLQRKDTPPDAVSVNWSPAQMEGLAGVMLHTGGLPTCVTITSAKQLSDGFSESVIEKR